MSERRVLIECLSCSGIGYVTIWASEEWHYEDCAVCKCSGRRWAATAEIVRKAEG